MDLRSHAVRRARASSGDLANAGYDGSHRDGFRSMKAQIRQPFVMRQSADTVERCANDNRTGVCDQTHHSRELLDV
jgi:hypothetical protein